ncbi:MAG: histidine kinase [Bacteroidota bacterium]
MNRTSTSNIIRYQKLFGILGLYVFAWLSYGWALFFTSGSTDWDYFVQAGLDYLCKGIMSIPVWWLVFRKFRRLPSWKRYLSHIVLIPLWVFCWMKFYYLLADNFGKGHLYGTGIGWDIYIPTLFYFIQFGAFHLYDESRRLIQQEKDAVELREIALQSELTALKAQLNPHFLYNVFNTINASLSPKEEYTRELIAKLADLFRYQLKASKKEKVLLEDEIEFNQTYLELEKARFQDRLEIHWFIDPGLRSVLVPPMILQPIIENAIRHGISPKIEGGQVEIRIQQLKEEIQVQVVDNGVGFSPKADLNQQGVGLSNIRKILDRIYGRSLDIVSDSSIGTKVQFLLPIEYASQLVPA